jgi:hypothetical protein
MKIEPFPMKIEPFPMKIEPFPPWRPNQERGGWRFAIIFMLNHGVALSKKLAEHGIHGSEKTWRRNSFTNII